MTNEPPSTPHTVLVPLQVELPSLETLQAMRAQRTKKRLYVVAFLVLLVCVELSGVVGRFLNAIENWHFSLRQRAVVESRVDQPIAIVGIDSHPPHLTKVFGRWPFKRDVYGYFVRYFNRAEAKMLVFDIAFNGGEDLDDPQKDQAFAQSVRQSTIPIASIFETKLTQQWPDPATMIPPAISREKIQLGGNKSRAGFITQDWLSPPILPLQESPMHFLAARNLQRDANDKVRNTNPFIAFGPNYVFPTLPLAMALNGESHLTILENGDLKTPSHLFHFQGQLYPIIRWHGDARKSRGSSAVERALHSDRVYRNETLGPITGFLEQQWRQWTLKGKQQLVSRPSIYKQFPFWDVLYTEIRLECQEDKTQPICPRFDFSVPGNWLSPQQFKGQYVLIGHTIENDQHSGDVHPAIYDSDYNGIYLQANILDNYLNNHFVRKFDGVWTWVAALLILLLSVKACLRRSITYSTLLVLTMAGSYTFWSFWAYSHLNWWVNWVIPMATLMAVYMGSFSYRYFASEKRKQQLRFAFAKYVSEGVMQSIEKNPDKIQLGGQRKELTMLFCDIRGFTAYSETHEPEVVQAFLTQYFSVMNRIILHEYNGSINKLIGDALLAYWGFPLETEDHPTLAVGAALRMKAAIAEWNAAHSEDHPIHIGIGINTGDAMIGNVGSEDFMDFTVIGDAVNTASRLEAENKTYGTTIIISESTYQRVKETVVVKSLGKVSVKGKEQPIGIYEPIGFKTMLLESTPPDQVETPSVS